MGKISLSSFQEPDSAVNSDTTVKPDEQDDAFPIQPKTVKETDLPFIPSDEVGKRDGKANNRLCT